MEKKIQNVPVANAEQLLQGKVAGLNIQNNTGAPGLRGSTQIRGLSSLSRVGSSLYIIDGVITKLTSISEVSPADIKSIEVLKDAEATALYGEKGKNGVIIITTVSGKYALVKPQAEVQIRKNFNETAFFYPDLKNRRRRQYQFFIYDARSRNQMGK